MERRCSFNLLNIDDLKNAAFIKTNSRGIFALHIKIRLDLRKAQLTSIGRQRCVDRNVTNPLDHCKKSTFLSFFFASSGAFPLKDDTDGKCLHSRNQEYNPMPWLQRICLLRFKHTSITLFPTFASDCVQTILRGLYSNILTTFSNSPILSSASTIMPTRRLNVRNGSSAVFWLLVMK